MEEIEETTLMDKKVDDLTVGDALKLNGAILAAYAGFAVAWLGGAVAYNKYAEWKYQRELKKFQNDPES